MVKITLRFFGMLMAESSMDICPSEECTVLSNTVFKLSILLSLLEINQFASTKFKETFFQPLICPLHQHFVHKVCAKRLHIHVYHYCIVAPKSLSLTKIVLTFSISMF